MSCDAPIGVVVGLGVVASTVFGLVPGDGQEHFVQAGFLYVDLVDGDTLLAQADQQVRSDLRVAQRGGDPTDLGRDTHLDAQRSGDERASFLGSITIDQLEL